jgi:hypothetical protein
VTSCERRRTSPHALEAVEVEGPVRISERDPYDDALEALTGKDAEDPCVLGEENALYAKMEISRSADPNRRTQTSRGTAHRCG